jgi:transposase InsO family protein
MCQLGEVSRAGYYRRWRAIEPREEETGMRDRLQTLALAHRHYGYRRLGVLLRREGWQANHKRVLRLLRTDNLLCLRRRAFVPPTTDSQHGWRVWPNLARWIRTTAVNQLWVADITYIRLKGEFVFLAVVLDAHSRCVVGWAIDRHLGTILALRALKMALESRQPEPGMIHHSDRGVQYACSDYVEMLQQHGIQISMSRVGNPYDNAKAESFIKTLKQEEVNGREYRDLDHLQQSLAGFLENIYNGRRLHSALGYQSPREYEASLMKSAAEDTIQGTVEKGGGCPLPPRPHPPQNLNSSVPVFSVSE